MSNTTASHSAACDGTARPWVYGTCGYGSLRTVAGTLTACCRVAACDAAEAIDPAMTAICQAAA
jgi:hypothetical protein